MGIRSDKRLVMSYSVFAKHLIYQEDGKFQTPDGLILAERWSILAYCLQHYHDIIMSAMVSQITGVSIVCSTVGSGADHGKHQSSVSLAFVRGIHWWPVNSAYNRPVTRKMFPFDDVIMKTTRFVSRAASNEDNRQIFVGEPVHTHGVWTLKKSLISHPFRQKIKKKYQVTFLKPGMNRVSCIWL